MFEKKGFTLVEIMVVVVIIGILTAIAWPRYVKTAEKARISEARSILGALKDAEMVYYIE